MRMQKKRLVQVVFVSAAVWGLIGCKQNGDGCTKDTDCKGERVCERRICVLPERAAAPTASRMPAELPKAPEPSPAEDRLIEPGVKVGAISQETSEAELKQIYGSSNVAREAWHVGEGQYRKATVLFKGTHDEAWVLWQGDDYGVVERVAFIGSGWRTSEGLRVGTPIEKLNAMNGRPFEFYGWGWDYGGTVKDWKAGAFGRFDEKLLVRLTRNHETDWGKEFEDAVLGDKGVSSELDGLAAVDTRVSVMEAAF